MVSTILFARPRVLACGLCPYCSEAVLIETVMSLTGEPSPVCLLFVRESQWLPLLATRIASVEDLAAAPRFGGLCIWSTKSSELTCCAFASVTASFYFRPRAASNSFPSLEELILQALFSSTGPFTPTSCRWPLGEHGGPFRPDTNH